MKQAFAALISTGFVLVLGGCASTHIDAPPNNPAPVVLPEVETSSVTVPITLNLDTAKAELLKRVPNPLAAGSMTQSVKINFNNPLASVSAAAKPCEGNSISCLANKALANVGSTPAINYTLPVDAKIDYQAFLRDVNLTMTGNRFNVDAFIEFSVAAKLQNATQVGLAGVSCGVNEVMPRLQFSLPGTVKVGGKGAILIERGQWQLKWLKPCNLSPLNLNVEAVTNLPVIRGKLEETINDQLEQLPFILALRPQLEKMWPQIASPMQIYPGMWLTLDPAVVGLGDIVGNGKLVSTAVTIKAKPQVVSSVEKPKRPLPPLPELTKAEKNEGFHVALRGDIDLEQANSLLNQQLANKPFDADGRTVLIDSIRVYGNEDRAVLGLKLKEPIQSEIFVLGKPVFDPVQNMLSFENLDFSLATSNALVNSAAWMMKGSFRQTLQEKARIAFDKDLGGAMDKLKSLRFDLGQGLLVRASVDRIQPRGVYFTQTDIKAFVAVDGKLWFDYGMK